MLYHMLYYVGSVNDASSEAVLAEAESIPGINMHIKYKHIEFVCALGISNEGSRISIESNESEEEVKQKPNTKHNGLSICL